MSLFCCDRNVGISLRRLWRSMNLWQKIKLFLQSDNEEIKDINKVDASTIERLKDKDQLNKMLLSLGEKLPIVKKILIDERDTYMSSNIYQNLDKINVAVVGAGHVPGMLHHFENLEELEEKDIKEMERIPRPSLWGKGVAYLIPAIIILGFVWGFFTNDIEDLKIALKGWVLANGMLSALGTLLAFGHPLAILSAFIAAPITSLNPTIGAAMVVGLVQALLVPPTIKDIEEMQFKITKISSWWKNKLGRVLLVSLFAGIGSMIGTYVGFAFIVRLF